MILIFRKYVIKFLLFLSFLSVCLSGLTLLYSVQNKIDSFYSIKIYIIWFNISTQSDPNVILSLMSLFIQSLFSFLFSFFVYKQIKRNPSPELFFIYIFIFSFSFHCLRADFIIPPSVFNLLSDTSLTRIIYFSRFLGLLSFLAASLFTLGLQNSKVETLFLISFSISYTLALTISVNTSAPLSSFLFEVSPFYTINIFTLAIELFTVINYFVAAIIKKRKEIYNLGLGSLLILFAYEALFSLYPPLFILGIITLIIGMILFLGMSIKLYIWY